MSNVREQILNEVETSSNSTRVITVVTTVGKTTKFSFTGSKWRELKAQLSSGGTDVNGSRFSGFSLGNIKAVESTRKATLEHDDAVIPNEDFVLFLMPYKSKSGATKAPAKKATATKKAPAKKAAVKKTTTKVVAKKVAPKKVAPKKAATKKVVAKKTVTKTATTKKTISPKKKESIANVVESVKKAKVEISPELENSILSKEMAAMRNSFTNVR